MDLSSCENCSKTPVLATTCGRSPPRYSAPSPRINYRGTLRLLKKIEGVLRTVGFDWTTAYCLYRKGTAVDSAAQCGAYPVYLSCCARPRRAALCRSSQKTGSREPPVTLLMKRSERNKSSMQKAGAIAVSTAAYFSLISAVNIGFEQFTPGDRIRRLQTREYSLEAVGWIRLSQQFRRCSARTLYWSWKRSRWSTWRRSASWACASQRAFNSDTARDVREWIARERETDAKG